MMLFATIWDDKRLTRQIYDQQLVQSWPVSSVGSSVDMVMYCLAKLFYFDFKDVYFSPDIANDNNTIISYRKNAKSES